jgi:hypothetical protein
MQINADELSTLPVGTVLLSKNGTAGQIVEAHDRRGDILLYFVGGPDPFDAGHEGLTGKWFDPSDWGPFTVLFTPPSQ